MKESNRRRSFVKLPFNGNGKTAISCAFLHCNYSRAILNQSLDISPFHPSSTIKIEIKRESRLIGNHFVGQYTGKAIELLDNGQCIYFWLSYRFRKLTRLDATFDLKDETGAKIIAKIKIDLSLVDTNFKTFMEDVDNDISRLGSPSNPHAGIPALGMAWSLTKNIMDNIADVRYCYSFSLSSRADLLHGKAHPILKASWTIISYVYKVNSFNK